MHIRSVGRSVTTVVAVTFAVLAGVVAIRGIQAASPDAMAQAAPGMGTPPQGKAMDQGKTMNVQTKAKMSVHMSRKEEIMNVQKALNAHGSKLKVDGIDGPKTRRALRAYQSANGLKRTGRMDEATMKHLGVQ